MFHKNNYNQYKGNSSAAGSSSPYASIPLALSLLLADSLFTHHSSPVAAMIIPLKTFNLPYSYFVIIVLDLATALFAKWSSSYSGISPLSQYQQAYPDIQVYRQGNNQLSSGNANVLRSNSTGNQQPEATPLFPEGLAASLALSSPFSGVPNSIGTKFVTIYGVEVLRIQHLPKTFIPLLTLFIYFYLYPKYVKKTNNTEQK